MPGYYGDGYSSHSRSPYDRDRSSSRSHRDRRRSRSRDRYEKKTYERKADKKDDSVVIIESSKSSKKSPDKPVPRPKVDEKKPKEPVKKPDEATKTPSRSPSVATKTTDKKPAEIKKTPSKPASAATVSKEADKKPAEVKKTPSKGKLAKNLSYSTPVSKDKVPESPKPGQALAAANQSMILWKHPTVADNFLLEHTKDIYILANDPEPEELIKTLKGDELKRHQKLVHGAKSLCDMIFEFQPNSKNPDESSEDGYFAISTCVSSFSHKFRRYILENRYIRANRQDHEEESHYTIIKIPGAFENVLENILEFIHTGVLKFHSKYLNLCLRLIFYFDLNLGKDQIKEIAKLGKVKLYWPGEKSFQTQEEKTNKTYEKVLSQQSLLQENKALKKPILAEVSDEAVTWDSLTGYGCSKPKIKKKEEPKKPNKQTQVADKDFPGYKKPEPPVTKRQPTDSFSSDAPAKKSKFLENSQSPSQPSANKQPATPSWSQPPAKNQNTWGASNNRNEPPKWSSPAATKNEPKKSMWGDSKPSNGPSRTNPYANHVAKPPSGQPMGRPNYGDNYSQNDNQSSQNNNSGNSGSNSGSNLPERTTGWGAPAGQSNNKWGGSGGNNNRNSSGGGGNWGGRDQNRNGPPQNQNRFGSSNDRSNSQDRNPSQNRFSNQNDRPGHDNRPQNSSGNWGGRDASQNNRGPERRDSSGPRGGAWNENRPDSGRNDFRSGPPAFESRNDGPPSSFRPPQQGGQPSWSKPNSTGNPTQSSQPSWSKPSSSGPPENNRPSRFDQGPPQNNTSGMFRNGPPNPQSSAPPSQNRWSEMPQNNRPVGNSGGNQSGNWQSGPNFNSKPEPSQPPAQPPMNDGPNPNRWVPGQKSERFQRNAAASGQPMRNQPAPMNNSGDWRNNMGSQGNSRPGFNRNSSNNMADVEMNW